MILEIEKIVLEKNLYYKNTLVLKYNISYPRITSNFSFYGVSQFNQYNRIKALELKLYAEKDLFELAKNSYSYQYSNSFPITVYELIYDFTISYNENYILSLYSNEYEFTGGAHGNTTRNSQNWNIKLGNMFSLDYIFKNDSSYLLYILREINQQIRIQIDNGTNQYFDNYCRFVLDKFNLNQFYLTPNDIVIFFQQCDIAPYSSGIPTFFIPR